MANEPTPETIDAQEARRRTVARLQAANGHAPVARRLNGANGHAPAPPPEQINWAPIIAASEVRFERQLAELREQVAELVSKPTEVVATSLSDDLIKAWAKGTVPFIRECIADAVEPLKKDIAELQTVVRTLVQSAAGRHE